MFKKIARDAPTKELFLGDILEREWCAKHDASQGQPCWYLYNSAGGTMYAICNSRAVKAGYSHPISEKSLRINKHKR